VQVSWENKSFSMKKGGKSMRSSQNLRTCTKTWTLGHVFWYGVFCSALANALDPSGYLFLSSNGSIPMDMASLVPVRGACYFQKVE